MQDEINEKVVVLCIRGTKITADTLKLAIKSLLNASKNKLNEHPHGKQTLKQLLKQDTTLNNIEITEDNIKLFEKTAKKYGVDFALIRSNSNTSPKHYVFFRSRDIDVLTMAFNEFSVSKLEQNKKTSVRSILSKFKESTVLRNTELVNEKAKELER